MRARLHEILNGTRTTDRVARIVGGALLLLVAVNVIASIIETDREIRTSAPRLFHGFEVASVAVFSAEYLLRMWACGTDPRYRGFTGRLRFALTPLMLVDLVAIAPFYVELLVPGALDLRYLRALRLLRIFRFARTPTVRGAIATLSRVIHAKRMELGVTLVVVFVAMLLAAGALYLTERGEPGTLFTSIPRAMWWSICTITTIGYGDMVPATASGRIIAGAVAFIGICALALPVGILSSGFIDEISRTKPPTTRCPHCDGALDAE